MGAAYRISSDLLYDYYFGEDKKRQITTSTIERIYPTEGLCNQYMYFLSEPTYIMDNIYLGSAYNASNFAQLKNLKIEAIINMTNDITNHFPEDIIYERYGLEDNNQDNIEEYLLKAYNFILKHQKNKKILVHCKMGASRSATIVLFYLIKKYKMNMDLALDFLKKKRVIINPNCLFMKTLKKYDL
jgi:rhodanese-related sulfurtransferase